MNENDGFKGVYVPTKLTTSNLTDDELAGLVMTVALGNDPRQWYKWDLVDTLFTSKNPDGVPIMHDLTKEALNIIYNERLGEQHAD